VGGTNSFWEQRGWAGRADLQITTLNLAAQERRHENIQPLIGDALDLSQFGNQSFDIVFSNSVIEHLSSLANQRRMLLRFDESASRFGSRRPISGFPWNPIFTYGDGNGRRWTFAWQCYSDGLAAGWGRVLIPPKLGNLWRKFVSLGKPS
jgi:Methyltransferase domain